MKMTAISPHRDKIQLLFPISVIRVHQWSDFLLSRLPDVLIFPGFSVSRCLRGKFFLSAFIRSKSFLRVSAVRFFVRFRTPHFAIEHPSSAATLLDAC